MYLLLHIPMVIKNILFQIRKYSRSVLRLHYNNKHTHNFSLFAMVITFISVSADVVLTRKLETWTFTDCVHKQVNN